MTVDYDRTVEEGVRAGKYDYANSDITSEHFPTKRQGEAQLEPILVHFNRYIGSDEVITELDKLGLRAGETRELLAFGAKHPDKQREFPIVALDGPWQETDDHRDVSCLNYWLGKRGLRLPWFGVVWHRDYRFLAFRK